MATRNPIPGEAAPDDVRSLVRSSTPGAGDEIHQTLERPNWAPWLRFSSEQFEEQGRRFADGQFFLRDVTLRPAACLTTNRIQWVHDETAIPNWDGVCGPHWTFDGTYQADGNALVFLSMAVRPDLHGHRVPGALIAWAREYAAAEGIRYLLCPLRPSEYGVYKLAHPDPGFEDYTRLTRHDGRPIDRWMRTGCHEGLEPLGVDRRAMVVPASYEEFLEYQTEHHPELWRLEEDQSMLADRVRDHEPLRELPTVDEVWECGETGTWYVARDLSKAVYIESNLLCLLPTVWPPPVLG
jgi:GNAT superfamily N-acetyltransferase